MWSVSFSVAGSTAVRNPWDPNPYGRGHDENNHRVHYDASSGRRTNIDVSWLDNKDQARPSSHQRSPLDVDQHLHGHFDSEDDDDVQEVKQAVAVVESKQPRDKTRTSHEWYTSLAGLPDLSQIRQDVLVHGWGPLKSAAYVWHRREMTERDFRNRLQSVMTFADTKERATSSGSSYRTRRASEALFARPSNCM
jgi:hypothetical protein